jgi:maltose phosphorylase
VALLFKEVISLVFTIPIKQKWMVVVTQYFAKVLNAPNWIGIDIEINGENLDLNQCKAKLNFRRESNMKGVGQRSFILKMELKSR